MEVLFELCIFLFITGTKNNGVSHCLDLDLSWVSSKHTFLVSDLFVYLFEWLSTDNSQGRLLRLSCCQSKETHPMVTLRHQNNLKWGSVDDLNVSITGQLWHFFLALWTPQSNFIPVRRRQTARHWISAEPEPLVRTYNKQTRWLRSAQRKENMSFDCEIFFLCFTSAVGSTSTSTLGAQMSNRLDIFVGFASQMNLWKPSLQSVCYAT